MQRIYKMNFFMSNMLNYAVNIFKEREMLPDTHQLE